MNTLVAVPVWSQIAKFEDDSKTSRTSFYICLIKQKIA